MKCSIPIGLLCILALSAGTPTQALSQWSLGLGVEADRFWGGSLENGPEQKSFLPYRPTVFASEQSIALGVSGWAFEPRTRMRRWASKAKGLLSRSRMHSR